MELWNKTIDTAAPTMAPTMSIQKVRFTCGQQLDGVTYEDFFEQVDETIPAFFDSLAKVGKVSSSSGVFEMQTTKPSSSVRRKLQVLSNSTYLYEISLILGVDTSWTEPADAYSAFVMYVNTAIEDGNLTKLLRSSNVDAFASANASKYLDVGPYTVSDVSNSDDSSTSHNGLSLEGVIGITLGAFFIVVILFSVYWSKYGFSLESFRITSSRNPMQEK